MEFQFKKNVRVVVDLEIGETILIEDWGYRLNGKHVIEDIKPSYGGCESGILIKISGYDSYIDSGWATKFLLFGHQTGAGTDGKGNKIV